jgi:hypothetical protein
MTDVIDGNVVVLAPEKGDCSEASATSEDVASGRLPLSLRDDPVLDPDAFAGVGVGPECQSSSEMPASQAIHKSYRGMGSVAERLITGGTATAKCDPVPHLVSRAVGCFNGDSTAHPDWAAYT